MSASSSSPSLRKVAALVALVPLVVGACGSSKKSSTSPTTANAAPATTVTTGASPETITLDGRQVVVRGRQAVTGTAALEVDDNYFKPNLLTAPAGSTVTIDVQSKAVGVHNFSVVGQAVDVDVQAGKSASAKVTVPATGQLVFFCKYHRDESGMVGAFNAA